MKTIKVSEATGPALDWLVAKCEGLVPPEKIYCPECDGVGTMTYYGMAMIYDHATCHTCDGECMVPLPAGHRWWANYADGPMSAYPIITRELIGTGPRPEGSVWPDAWLAASPKDDAMFWGATPLIAAMRCYVTSKLGDTVEVPEELV